MEHEGIVGVVPLISSWALGHQMDSLGVDPSPCALLQATSTCAWGDPWNVRSQAMADHRAAKGDLHCKGLCAWEWREPCRRIFAARAVDPYLVLDTRLFVTAFAPNLTESFR